MQTPIRASKIIVKGNGITEELADKWEAPARLTTWQKPCIFLHEERHELLYCTCADEQFAAQDCEVEFISIKYGEAHWLQNELFAHAIQLMLQD